MTPVGRAIAVELVPGVLERLPDTAWPYGLIVAVQDVGVLSGKSDLPRKGFCQAQECFAIIGLIGSPAPQRVVSVGADEERACAHAIVRDRKIVKSNQLIRTWAGKHPMDNSESEALPGHCGQWMVQVS